MDPFSHQLRALSGLLRTFFPLVSSGLLEKLTEVSLKLEEIQKALDLYLETKRQIFPRFYFLSNDDVLEILGQSQNPRAMQPHLKKCFDNIKSLNIEDASAHTHTLSGQSEIRAIVLVKFKVLHALFQIYTQESVKAL